MGKRRLETAIARLRVEKPDVEVKVRWLPFFLDASLPASLVKRDHYNSKFGADRVAAMIPQMESVGLKETPPIKFSYGGTLGNTLDSHRLIEYAYEVGGAPQQDALVESLFSRYFEQEQNPASHEVLSAAAVEAGLGDADTILAFLKSEVNKAEVVRTVEQKRREFRVSGVPHFVIGKEGARAYSVSGAQEADTLMEIFEELAE